MNINSCLHANNNKNLSINIGQQDLYMYNSFMGPKTLSSATMALIDKYYSDFLHCSTVEELSTFNFIRKLEIKLEKIVTVIYESK